METPDWRQLYSEISNMDELTFWSRQFSEHALFLSKGYKAGRKELIKLGLENLIEEGLRLNAVWKDIFQRARDGEQFTNEDLNQPLDDLKTYLMDGLHLSEQTWVGYNYPSVFKHYHEEWKYFVDRLLNQNQSFDRNINFWIDMHKDHAAVFAHLLDPMEREKFEQALNYNERFEQWLDRDVQDEIGMITALMQDFNSFTSDLRQDQAEGNLKSVINPLLALHIYREGIRSIIFLESSY